MKNQFRFLLSVSIPFVLAFLLSGCPPPPATHTVDGDGTADELFTLTVLHTNDCHARIRQFNDHGNSCSDEEAAEGECFGGVARRATEINRIRDEKQNVILVDAGDQFQGTLYYTQYKGEEARTFMNLLSYDVMTLGNHEFDDGPENLARFIGGLEFPVVSANVNVAGEPLLADLVKPYHVMEIEGHKVGFFGLTTPDVPDVSNPGPNIVFEDLQSSARNAVESLQNEGVNIIIALSHSGFATDVELGEAVGGIDIIVGGHTHTYLSNTDPDAEVKSYPYMITSLSDEPVLVVQAKSWGRLLGELEVQFDEEGVVAEWSGDPILLDQSIAMDEEILALAEEMGEVLLPMRETLVGSTLVPLDGAEEIVRHQEANSGNLLADAFLWDVKEQGVQIALINGGGIRSGLPAGEITMENVLEILPFRDTLATMGITGSDFRLALEHGVSRAESTQNEGTGRFLQVAGARYSWNPRAEAMNRIVSVEIQNPDGTYSPLVDDEIYMVACSDYLRTGGDGFTIFRDGAIDPYDFGRGLSEIFMDYLREYSPVSPGIEGRISIVE